MSPDASVEMWFDVASLEDSATVVTIGGELDIASVDRLERAVAPVIEAKPDRLIVDVAELRFADSSAIALWVKWATALGTIELREPSPLLRTVIRSMGLEQRFQLSG